jgi:hypothetical protein
VTRIPGSDAPRTPTAWRIERRSIDVAGAAREIRLVRFDAGWLASVDTDGGPTLGADRSPYLAVILAVEELGIDSVEAMTVVGPIAR